MKLPLSHFGLKGRARISVVERGIVVREYPEISNLILNRGLDDIATNSIPNCITYCAAGTGVTATEADGGANTASVATGVLTISTIGFLNGDSTDVGKTVKLTGSGNTYLIVAASSTTQCFVSPGSTTEGPDNFIIYNTNQTGLTAESTNPGPTTKRTSTYLTGAPFCQTFTVGDTTLMTRTYDFAVESGSITYNEIGFSSTNTVGSNLFSRIKLPAGVPLTAGQQLRVQYSLSVKVSPITPQTYATSPVIGWPSGTGTMQHILIPMQYINTNGFAAQGLNGVDGLYYGNAGEPSISVNVGLNIESASSAHPSYGSLLHATQVNLLASSLSSYVSGSYTRDKFATYPVGSVNATNWRNYMIYVNFGDGLITVGTRFLFDTAQTKASTFTLTLGFRTSWGRIL